MIGNNIECYSANFKTGTRTYFINLLQTNKGAYYVRITESHKVSENEYHKNRIMLFNQDLHKLAKILNRAIEKIDGAQPADNEITFPNSGKRWSREDEEKLEFLYKAGKTIEDLTEIFGRKQKGIENRLEKLGLIER